MRTALGVLLVIKVGEPVALRIVTAPDATCSAATWTGAVAMLRSRLARRFGAALAVEHVTTFSPRFFELKAAADAVEAGEELPLVFVGDTLVSRGGKLSESRIVRALRATGVGAPGGAER